MAHSRPCGFDYMNPESEYWVATHWIVRVGEFEMISFSILYGKLPCECDCMNPACKYWVDTHWSVIVGEIKMMSFSLPFIVHYPVNVIPAGKYYVRTRCSVICVNLKWCHFLFIFWYTPHHTLELSLFVPNYFRLVSICTAIRAK